MVSVGIDGIDGLGPLPGAGGVLNRRLGSRAVSCGDQAPVHPRDIIDQEAQVTVAGIAGSGTRRVTFEPPILEQLDACGALAPRDAQEDHAHLRRRDRGQIEDVGMVDQGVGFDLKSQNITVEMKGALHVADRHAGVKDTADVRGRLWHYSSLSSAAATAWARGGFNGVKYSLYLADLAGTSPIFAGGFSERVASSSKCSNLPESNRCE